MKELWFKTQSESLWKSIEDIHLQIDRREKELEATPETISILEVARRHWEKGSEAGGFQSYLGQVYGCAAIAQANPDTWKTKRGKEILAEKLMLSLCDLRFEDTGELDCEAATDVAAFRNAESCVDFLRAIGCKAINVKWKLGLKRGKVAWVAGGLDLEFSVGISNHTDIQLVISTDDPELMRLA